MQGGRKGIPPPTFLTGGRQPPPPPPGSYAYGSHIAIPANPMQVTFLGNINDSLATNLITWKSRKTLKCASERIELTWKFSHLYVPKLPFLSLFELVLTNFVCMFLSVTLLHNLRIFCLFSQLMLMIWHYKRLSNCRQYAHSEIYYVCEGVERARKILAFWTQNLLCLWLFLTVVL